MDESSMNASFNKPDYHIDVSQDNKLLEYNEYDYKCKYDNIFKEHIKIHKGDKTQNPDEVYKLMLIHKGEKSFKCEICELVF